MLLTLDEQGKAAHGPGPVFVEIPDTSVYACLSSNTSTTINRFLMASQILFFVTCKIIKKNRI